MTNPDHYRRGPILARKRLLTFEAEELESGRSVYLHLFPVAQEDFQSRLANDAVTWLSTELRVEEYKGSAYIVSPPWSECLDIEAYILDAVERARSKYETQIEGASEPVDNETAEFPTTTT